MTKLSTKQKRLLNEVIENRIKRDQFIKRIGSNVFSKATHGLREKLLTRQTQRKNFIEENRKAELIKRLLNSEKNKILVQKTLDIYESSDLSSNYNCDDQNDLRLSEVSATKMNNFLANLEKSVQNVKKYRRNKCTPQIHNIKTHWNSPTCLMKAITHSIVTRNWYNFTHLLFKLIHFTKDDNYVSLIYEVTFLIYVNSL